MCITDAIEKYATNRECLQLVIVAESQTNEIVSRIVKRP